jgi:hypothetical protein
VPESALSLSADPPPAPASPRTGPADAAVSSFVTLRVAIGEGSVELAAWCRVGVWTTLERARPEPFVVREAWGRLGERAPRRLLRVQDQALSGVVARVRPEEDGGVSFLVEVSESRIEGDSIAGIFHGRRVTLPKVRRHGYRLAGRAPPGWRGAVARWLPGPEVELGAPGAGVLPERAVRFRGDGVDGFVAGRRVLAEAFREEWHVARPVRVEADGVERVDYRLEKKRSAAGLRSNERGGLVRYGAAFEVQRE